MKSKVIPKTYEMISYNMFSLDPINPGPEVIKLFSCSTQLGMKFGPLINLTLLTTTFFFLQNIAEHEFSLLINMKMLTIVGIFIFISRENSCSAELN